MFGNPLFQSTCLSTASNVSGDIGAGQTFTLLISPPVYTWPSPSLIMESLSELQNPLLDKSSMHVRKGRYNYQGDFSSSQYQENIINYFVTGSSGSCKAKAQQLLDATSLHLAVDAFYRPDFILYKDNLNLKNSNLKSECCETSFTEDKNPAADVDGSEEPQVGLARECNGKIQTVSYEVEEEDYLECEVREQTCSDMHKHCSLL